MIVFSYKSTANAMSVIYLLPVYILFSMQVQQAADENTELNGHKQVWRCESQRTYTTVKEYAKYQKQMLQKKVSYNYVPI